MRVLFLRVAVLTQFLGLLSLQNKATMDGCLVQGWPGYSPLNGGIGCGAFAGKKKSIIIISSSIHNTTAEIMMMDDDNNIMMN